MINLQTNQKGDYVINIIKDLLDLKEDRDLKIVDVKIDDEKRIKAVTVEKVIVPMFCPKCGSRMYSKGYYERKVKHPVLDDGYSLLIILRQRKYRCSSRECNHYTNDQFFFVEKGKRMSDLTPILILNDLKEITVSAAVIARKRKVSETYVHEVVLRYLDFKRLPLPEILCIDEVYLNISKDARYSVVLRDFITDEIIDILPNRYEKTFEDYFLHIPREERLKVKYIVSDMYEPYLNMPKKYLNAAESVIDSFHVISWINNKINLYINTVKKRYQKEDDEIRKEKNILENKDFVKRKDSKEVYLLKNHRWVLLMNDDNKNSWPYTKRFNQLGGYYSSREIEEMFLSLDPHFKPLKDLKEKYISFNNECLGDIDEASFKLDKLIEEYNSSEYSIFKEFAEILSKRRKEILASFTAIPTNIDHSEIENEYRRMSNGPQEGFNRKPKDLKRTGRGYSNFDYLRNRILWVERKDAHILACPKTIAEVRAKYKTKKKRGKYNKHNKK